jgi:small-conductance mechanosensitive channel
MTIDSFLNKTWDILNYTLFSINETPVSLYSVLIFLLILIGFVIISKLFNNRILLRALSKFRIEEGLQFTFTRISQYIIVFIGVTVALQFIGIDLTGLAVVLGFLSVGIGFGLQNITSNFIAGVILLFERPIKVGDRVTVGDTEGDVKYINIRSTTIQSLNNIAYIVPNSEFISTTVINWSHGDKKIRIDLDIGVSYNSDLDLVMEVLRNIAKKHEEVLQFPEPEVHFREFGDSSWNMKLRAWIDHPKRHYYVRSDLNCEIVREFRANNIEIPFPQRDLHLRTSTAVKIENSE